MESSDISTDKSPQYSIVVFSKDRPLQLHAYLESLLLFSDALPQNITVIYKYSEGINYAKVISHFPLINWHNQGDFYSDLMTAVSSSGKYILFGCDDVVFIRGFSILRNIHFLDEHEEVFGYSLRLGANISPMPRSIGDVAECCEWIWRDAVERHYNYPWELDCTIYRKSDVCQLLSNVGCCVSPNFLEEKIATVAKECITRPHLVCSAGHSQALVITVNRVQDTHLNPVDSRQKTDTKELNNLYNIDNNRLDIRAIANKENDKIHVGAEYFILEGRPQYSYQCQRGSNKQKYSFRTFFRNLRHLFKNDIVTQRELSATIDNYKFEISSELQTLIKPKIAPPLESINRLMLSGASLCRYGDGEFLIMRGKGIAFQEADDKLAQRLKEIIVSNNKNVLVGLPYLLYNPSSSLRGEIKNYCRVKAEQIRTYIDSVIDFQKEYVDTNSSQLFATYDQFDFYDYFTRVKRLWAGRDITIICGENVFKNIRHNIFLCAKSIDYQYAPSRDAYKGYTSILSQAQKIDKSRLVIIILGPTATVLAYDLSLCGYQALDFGHISKDYDWYLKGIKHKGKTLTAFFQPD